MRTCWAGRKPGRSGKKRYGPASAARLRSKVTDGFDASIKLADALLDVDSNQFESCCHVMQSFSLNEENTWGELCAIVADLTVTENKANRLALADNLQSDS